VGSVIASHRGGGGSTVTITALPWTRTHIHHPPFLGLTASDVNLVKIRIHRMRISTSKIRRMRMSLDKRLFYQSECNAHVYFK